MGERQRDIFPLPVPGAVPACPTSASRGAKRRTGRRVGHAQLVGDIVVALNEMSAGSDTFTPASFEPSRAQTECLDHIARCVADMGAPPDNLSAEEALRAVQADSSYEAEPSNVAPLRVDLVSLPEEGSTPIPLPVLLGRTGERRVEEFVDTKVVAKEVFQERRQASELRRPYRDPVLRDPHTYARLLLRLFRAGMVKWRSSGQGDYTEVGIFAVWKKEGRQRLILDARVANLWFEAPEHVSLCTASGFAQLELEEDEQLFVGGIDTKDAFYQMGLPPALERFFALSEVSVAALRGAGASEEELTGFVDKIRPVLGVLPMGWAHALAFCEEAHTNAIAEEEGIGSDTVLVDSAVPKPLSGGLHTEYVDNFLGLGTTPKVADDLVERAGRALRKRGLRLHEAEKAELVSTHLGWSIDGGRGVLMPRQDRAWRVRLAFQAILRRGRATGRQLSRLVGHYSFLALAHRPGYSVFDSVYRFIHRFEKTVKPFSASIVRELRWAMALIPLLRTNLRAPWSDTVLAVDASEHGRGVVERRTDSKLIQAAGRFRDRWRYQAGSQVRPRGDLERADDEDDGPVPRVPDEILKGQWKVLSSGGWDREEAMVVLEGRSVVHAIKHICRSTSNQHHRHLILSDNLSAVLALMKGRSSSRGLLRVCRQFCALTLACDLGVAIRWLPSEANPSDPASRFHIPIGYVSEWHGAGRGDEVQPLPPFRPRTAGDGLQAECPEQGSAPEERGAGAYRVPYHRARAPTAAERFAPQPAHAATKGGRRATSGRPGGEAAQVEAGACGRAEGRTKIPAGPAEGGRAARAGSGLSPTVVRPDADACGVPEGVQRHAVLVEASREQASRGPAGRPARRSTQCLDGGGFPRGGTAGDGCALGGGGEVLSAELRERGNVSVAPGPADAEGMAASEPGACPAPFAFRGGPPDLVRAGPPGLSLHSGVLRANDDLLPSALGGLHPPGGGLGPAAGRESPSALGDSAARFRDRRSLEDVGRGRGGAGRQPGHRVARPGVGFPEKDYSAGAAPLHVHPNRHGQALSRGGGQRGGLPVEAGALPAPAHRAFARLRAEAPVHRSDQGPRPLDERRQCEEVQEGGASGPAAGDTRPEHKAASLGGGPGSGGDVREALRRALARAGGPRFAPQLLIAVQAGRSGLGELARPKGVTVFDWDTSRGATWSFTDARAHQLLRGHIAAGNVWGLIVSVTDATWNPGCGARSAVCPFGVFPLPGEVPESQLRMATERLKGACSCFEMMNVFQKPWCVAAPSHSWVWSTPQLGRLRAHFRTRTASTHLCAWGAREKRATTIMGQRLDLSILNRTCSAATCGRRAKDHRPVSNVFTRKARWPFQLREYLLNVLVEAYGASATGPLQKLWGGLEPHPPTQR